MKELGDPPTVNSPLEMTINWYSGNAANYADSIEAWTPEQLDTFLQNVTPGGSILDIGSAGGRDTAIMAKRGFQVHGVDVAPGMVEEARRRHPDIKFDVADVRNLSLLENESQDGIWARAILLHMETENDVRQALAEIRRIAKKGAPIHIHVKARTGSKETEVITDSLTHAPRFFRYFTLEKLQQFLAESGIDPTGLIQYQQDDRTDVQWISGIVKAIDS